MSDDLRKLAEAATPGPWETWIEGEGDAWGGDPGVLMRTKDGRVQDASGQRWSFFEGGYRDEDVRYIAAVSPDVVLGLLDRAEQAEARERILRAALEDVLPWVGAYEDWMAPGDFDKRDAALDVARRALVAAPAPEEGA